MQPRPSIHKHLLIHAFFGPLIDETHVRAHFLPPSPYPSLPSLAHPLPPSIMKIAELGYEANVIREIAVLRTLSHPGNLDTTSTLLRLYLAQPCTYSS